MSITLFHSDPSTGEIFETKEVHTDEEKEFAMTKAGGYWWETPRWQRNPRPGGFDASNPYEKVVQTPFVEFPRVVYKFTHLDKDTKEPVFKTMKVGIDQSKGEAQKAAALKDGWQLTPIWPEKEKVSA